MDIRQLRYFVVLARELHFGRAAAALHLSQPPLSRQIKELERELGVILFARNNRNVQLTESGRILLDDARRILQSLDDARNRVSRAQRGEVGRLAVGYISAAAYSLLPRALRDLRQSHPDVELVLNEMTTPVQCEALLRGSIDVAIMRPSTIVPKLESRRILREPFIVALPVEHPLSRSRTVSIYSLSKESFIMLPSTGGGLPRQVRDLCLQAKFEPNVIQEANQTLSMLGLVAAGTGIALVPASAQEMIVRNVVYKPLRGAKGHTETLLAWQKGAKRPLIEHLLMALRNSAAKAAYWESGQVASRNGASNSWCP